MRRNDRKETRRNGREKNGEKCEILTAAGNKGSPMACSRLADKSFRLCCTIVGALVGSGRGTPGPFWSKPSQRGETTAPRPGWLSFTLRAAGFTGRGIQCGPVRVHPARPGAILSSRVHLFVVGYRYPWLWSLWLSSALFHLLSLSPSCSLWLGPRFGSVSSNDGKRNNGKRWVSDRADLRWQPTRDWCLSTLLVGRFFGYALAD